MISVRFSLFRRIYFFYPVEGGFCMAGECLRTDFGGIRVGFGRCL